MGRCLFVLLLHTVVDPTGAHYSAIVCGDGVVSNETNLLRVGDISPQREVPVAQCLEVAAVLSSKLRKRFPNSTQNAVTVGCYTECAFVADGGFGLKYECKSFLRSPGCDSMDNLRSLISVGLLQPTLFRFYQCSTSHQACGAPHSGP